MKNVKLLLLMSLFFITGIGFSQNYVTYSPQTKTIDLNSGVEGTVDVLVNCYGSTSDPVFLNALQSCANNDGIFSTSYTNGSILTPGQNTTIRYKFKKTVTANTQIAYKFSTDGSCFQDESKMIKITVNYKAVAANPITNNYISGNQTVYEGQTASILSGSTPSGGNGTFSYIWQKKRAGDGAYSIISGATGMNYSPGILAATTSFKRSVTSAGLTNTSAEITVTVIPAPTIQNNTITINGTSVDGSSPTGGTGSYTYSWGILDEDGDFSELTALSSQNVIFSNPAFTNYINSPKTFQLTRIVYSGTIRSFSNYVVMPHNSDIQNNTISINNNQVTGSIPTGGIGGYTYTWGILDEDGDFSELTALSSQNVMFSDPAFTNYINSPKTFKLTRIVYSGTTRSFSNYVIMPHSSGLSLNNIAVSTVYPNPTSDAVNFTTNSSSDKEIEIVIYSEGLRDAQSVFKGTITPNQIVKWNIPSNYSKGIYYYKIISDNKEVKSGKIIYQ